MTQLIEALCLSLNWVQPTWESHFLYAESRSVNGSGVELGPERRAGSMREGKGAEREGTWRRLEKKRERNVRESIRVMALEFGASRAW
ncbi:hypothetical protein CDL15_Pgr019534 [Punica granatum]|uniref:Uncharacterized protein n=1 Tax=Punica granatum TaxID=22663 RepID=A0A218X5P3_PUNGR|nr:hypothetical protein CDL15_Pgr019534 [Punica granatum]PKI36608.1 hypothetical protein CRG98_043028 [Punica granatum]